MTNAELIKALRYCGQERDVIDCADCERRMIENGVDVDCEGRLMRDAADALEAADKRIAELMPKEGEWIDEQRGRWIYAKCNLCGKVQDVRSNYCTNCGAKMKTVTDCHASGEGER